MDNYLDTAWQICQDDLEETASKEECFKEGYLNAQQWNNLPISDATYTDSEDLVLYAVKTRRRSFLSYKYDYFLAYYVEETWIEIHSMKSIEEGSNLKVIAWKPI